MQPDHNLGHRLERFHQRRNRRHPGRAVPLRAHGRPWRDRALVFVLLSTGLPREEIARLDLDQLAPGTPDALRQAHRARLRHERTVQGLRKRVNALAIRAQQASSLDLPPRPLASRPRGRR